jgi:hypothetical protein
MSKVTLPHPSRRLALGTLMTAALASALSACVIAPARPYYGQPYYAGEPVAVAPPPPQVEVYGPPPVVGQIWIGGFWNWVGGRHVWVGGHWEAPRPGYRWYPHQWHQSPRGWHLEHGHWGR